MQYDNLKFTYMIWGNSSQKVSSTVYRVKPDVPYRYKTLGSIKTNL